MTSTPADSDTQDMRDLAEAQLASMDYAEKVMVWTIGCMQALEEKGLVSEGNHRLEEPGCRIWRQLNRQKFRPYREDVLSCLSELVAKEIPPDHPVQITPQEAIDGCLRLLETEWGELPLKCEGN